MMCSINCYMLNIKDLHGWGRKTEREATWFKCSHSSSVTPGALSLFPDYWLKHRRLSAARHCCYSLCLCQLASASLWGEGDGCWLQRRQSGCLRWNCRMSVSLEEWVIRSAHQSNSLQKGFVVQHRSRGSFTTLGINPSWHRAALQSLVPSVPWWIVKGSSVIR